MGVAKVKAGRQPYADLRRLSAGSKSGAGSHSDVAFEGGGNLEDMRELNLDDTRSEIVPEVRSELIHLVSTLDTGFPDVQIKRPPQIVALKWGTKELTGGPDLLTRRSLAAESPREPLPPDAGCCSFVRNRNHVRTHL